VIGVTTISAIAQTAVYFPLILPFGIIIGGIAGAVEKRLR